MLKRVPVIILVLFTNSFHIMAETEINKDSFKISCESMSDLSVKYVWNETNRECVKFVKKTSPPGFKQAFQDGQSLKDKIDSNSNTEWVRALDSIPSPSAEVGANDNSFDVNQIGISRSIASSGSEASLEARALEAQKKLLAKEKQKLECDEKIKADLIALNGRERMPKWKWDGQACIDMMATSPIPEAKTRVTYEEGKKLKKKIEDQQVRPSKFSTEQTKKPGFISKSITKVKGFFKGRKEKRAAKELARNAKVCESQVKNGYGFYWDNEKEVCLKLDTTILNSDSNQKQKIDFAKKAGQKQCVKYEVIGQEDELDACIKKATSHADPKNLLACESVAELNPDIHRVCVAMISSTAIEIKKISSICADKIKNTSELELKKGAECIVSHLRNDMVLSKIPNVKSNNVIPSMPINLGFGFENELKSANDPDEALLNKCTLSLQENKSMNPLINGDLVFRTTTSQNKSPVDPGKMGMIVKSGKSSYLISDKEINVGHQKFCGDEKFCTFVVKVGSRFIELNSSKEVPDARPSQISFLGTPAPAMISNYNEIKAIKLEGDQSKYANAQLSRSVSLALSDEFLKYHKAEGNRQEITSEAYQQALNTIGACKDLMAQMAPEDKGVIAQSAYALESLDKLYKKDWRSISSESSEPAKAMSK